MQELERLEAAPVVRLTEVSSTNRYAREQGRGWGLGTSVLAQEQTAGRGRSGRSWMSCVGGVYASFLLEAPELRRSSELSLLASVAVADTFADYVAKEKISLKWPNDCLIAEKKVSGILCEVAEGTRCILGIGINVKTDPDRLAEVAITAAFAPASLADFCTSMVPDVETVFRVLRSNLFQRYVTYRAEGFAFLREAWESRCSFLGGPVQVDEGSRQVRGTFVGLAEDGALRLAPETEGAPEMRFYSGEVRCSWSQM